METEKYPAEYLTWTWAINIQRIIQYQEEKGIKIMKHARLLR